MELKGLTIWRRSRLICLLVSGASHDGHNHSNLH
jgi:hypothetical protein